MRSARIVLAFALVCAVVSPPTRIDPVASASQEPADTVIQLTPVLAGLSSPVFVTSALDGSGRLFIVEQAGRIKVVEQGSQSPTVFANIVSRVLSGGERGLLGLAFHPQYRTNGRFFVDYTRRPDGATVIAEYHVSADPNVAEPGETVLLTIPQPFANHNGGMVAFGPDGYLYIGMGDGGSANDPGRRAQNVNELLGKILRIDVDSSNGSTPYASPPSNPFFGGIPGRDEIYAFGLRNPWRFSFDRTTGDLYVGDVGQNAREEVDMVTNGGNYGWRVFEGTRCTNNDTSLCLNAAPFTRPIAEYDNRAGSGGRCSVTGGYVYRGTKSSLPAGAYVFGDYCTGEIILLNRGVQTLLLDTTLNISSFGEDEAGEIYVVGLGGTIQRIENPAVPPPPPPPPPPSLRVDSAVVRKRSSGEVLDPLTVKKNGKKFEIVVRGQGFPEGSVLVVNNRELSTEVGATGGQELVGRLRRDMLAEAGPLVVEIVIPTGAHSNQITISVLLN
jgi:glucose/arabinose dehydrogenase